LKVIGEVIEGELNKLVVALHSPKVRPEAVQPRLGDFVWIKTNEIRILGVVSHMRFHTREHPQPLGLTPEQVKAVLPDIEDVIYANVMKLVHVPVLGYFEDGKTYHVTPPSLPNIHDEAYIADDNIVKEFHQQENQLCINYLPRLLREDVENKAEVLAVIYKRLHNLLDLELKEFLKQLNSAYQEARGEQLPTSFAMLLNRLIR
jgi:hypothetical protein